MFLLAEVIYLVYDYVRRNVVSLEDVKKYCELFEQMTNLCLKNKWGDPFSYARSREIHMAGLLGHKISDTYSGADAINEKNEEVEYKSTINEDIRGSYTGISVFDNWEDQLLYLKNNKILKYKEHFYARYCKGKIVEIWKLSGNDVFNILLPKIKKLWEKLHFGKSKRKDPRLVATITKKEINKYGIKVL